MDEYKRVTVRVRAPLTSTCFACRLGAWAGSRISASPTCAACGGTGIPEMFLHFPANGFPPHTAGGNLQGIRALLNEARHNAIIELNRTSRLLTKLGGGGNVR